MVYLNAENNLSSDALVDLDEIVKGSKGLSSNCRLLVYIDDSYNSKNADSPYPRIYSISNGTKNLVKKYEEMDSSSPTVIRNVLNYIITNYPADEYVTIFWGHGTGTEISSQTSNSLSLQFDADANDPNAYGWDNNDNSSGSKPSQTWTNIPDLAAALDELPKQQLIMFDACLMLSAENAYELRNCTDYLIGAVCETPTFGANFEKLIPILGQSINQDTAGDIVNHYISDNTWGVYNIDRSDGVCISAVKTSEMENLLSATKTAFSSLDRNTLPLELTTKFAEDGDGATSCIFYFKTQRNRYAPPIYYDIKDVMRVNLSEDAYQMWLTALNKAVIATWHPRDIRQLTDGICPWIPTMLSGDEITNDFKKFCLSDERYGGMSIFVPQKQYESYTSPNMNKRMYDYEWCQKVGWEDLGWTR